MMNNLCVQSIFGSAVRDGRCSLSNVALARAKAGRFDGKIVCCGENVCVKDARYDEAEGALLLTLATEQGEIEQRIIVDYIPCAHPHPIAEGRMVELDPVAENAPDGKIALVGDSLFHNWEKPDVDMGLPGEVVNYGVGGYCIPNLQELVVPRYVFPTEPRCIIIHVGINDMFQNAVPLSTYLA
ncbi:MAG: hypothetical protein IIU63_07380, partial [Clostridia bacterium]|nr:hypothetical protein [Clostridia bacterium]